jgi:hypothetical protein
VETADQIGWSPMMLRYETVVMSVNLKSLSIMTQLETDPYCVTAWMCGSRLASWSNRFTAYKSVFLSDPALPNTM